MEGSNPLNPLNLLNRLTRGGMIKIAALHMYIPYLVRLFVFIKVIDDQTGSIVPITPDCIYFVIRSMMLSKSFSTAVPLDQIKYNDQGLVPAIAQDYLDGTVLMVAWMNREALERTLKSGDVWYWSRSRSELWHKGATSGHYQKLQTIRYDCDSDALLLTIEQLGDIACHTGERSCFHQMGDEKHTPPADTLSQVFEVICDRRDHPSPESYTCKLLNGGDNKILKKIGEEAAEVVMACKDDSKDDIAGEVADLFYHTLVALSYHHVDIRDVYRKLQERRR